MDDALLNIDGTIAYSPMNSIDTDKAIAHIIKNMHLRAGIFQYMHYNPFSFKAFNSDLKSSIVTISFNNSSRSLV